MSKGRPSDIWCKPSEEELAEVIKVGYVLWDHTYSEFGRVLKIADDIWDSEAVTLEWFDADNGDPSAISKEQISYLARNCELLNKQQNVI